MFNKNIGAELGINYLMGSKTEFTRTALNGSASKNEISGKMLQFKPTLVLTAGYSKINPYAKFGITLGQASAEATNTSTLGPITEVEVTELEGGLSVGIHSGLGLNYAITNKVTLFGEVLYTGVTFRPETATVTSATVNGTDVLNTYSVSDINTVFVTDYNTNNPQNNNLPNREDAIDIPFNNIGLNVGLKYGF